MLESVLTVQQHGITYRFRTRLYEAGDHLANPYEILIERRIYFENTRAAVAFLRRFSGNAFAVRGFRQMLSTPGFGSARRHDELADDWMDHLGLHLVTGRLAVIESIPRVPSGESGERSAPVVAVSRPAPRKEVTPARVEEVEGATFAGDADEEAQVKTLIDAAQAGTPFCEACARAAAAKARELKHA